MAVASTPGSCDARQIAAAAAARPAARPAARARIRVPRPRLKLAAVVSSLLHHMSSCGYTGLMSAHRN
jgi:hypothetical protein